LAWAFHPPVPDRKLAGTVARKRTAGLIFMSGGMNIAWSVGFRGAIYYSATQHNFVAWFIGAIIGAVASCLLANKVAKKYVLVSQKNNLLF